MNKVFFSDVIGTVSDFWPRDGYLLEFKNVTSFLDNFLEEDNSVVFLTSTFGHNSIENIIDFVLSEILKPLSKEKKEKIQIYASDSTAEIKKYGSIYISEYLPDIEVNLRGEKKEIILEEVLKKFNSESQFFCAGDGAVDINMLLKVAELGGRSIFINYYKKNIEKMSIDKIILEIATKKCNFILEHIKKTDDESFYLSSEYKSVLSEKQHELLKLFENKKINRDDLIFILSLIQIITEYIDYFYWKRAERNLIDSINYNELYNNISKKLVLIDDRSQLFDQIK